MGLNDFVLKCIFDFNLIWSVYLCLLVLDHKGLFCTVPVWDFGELKAFIHTVCIHILIFDLKSVIFFLFLSVADLKGVKKIEILFDISRWMRKMIPLGLILVEVLIDLKIVNKLFLYDLFIGIKRFTVFFRKRLHYINFYICITDSFFFWNIKFFSLTNKFLLFSINFIYSF